MRFRNTIIVFAALVAALSVLAFFMSAGRAEENERKTPLKIGVADLAYIVDNYIRRTDEEQKLQIVITVENERNQQIQSEIKALNDRISELSEKLSPDSPEIMNLRNEVELKKLMFKQRFEYTKAKLEAGKIQILKVIYEDFTKIARTYAEKNGYDFILSNNPPSLNSPTRDYDNLMLQISVQPVYFYREESNLTNTLVNFMNESYQASKAAKPEEPKAVGPENPAPPKE